VSNLIVSENYVKKSYWKLIAALLTAGLLTACQSGDSAGEAGTVLPETEVPAENTVITAPADDVPAAEPVQEDGEKKVTFVSGTSFSGTKRPTVDGDARYLPEEAADAPQSGKIVYSVNYRPAGKVEGSAVQTAGSASSEVRAVPALGYKFVKWSDGVTDAVRSGDTAEGVYTAIFDYAVLDMPIIVINTDDGNGITSKTEYENAKFSVLGCEQKYQIDEIVTEIRGRGNNSWGYPKKSYKFKLSEKQNLFGLANGKEKIWVLLANQCDQSLQRNHTAYEFARYFDAVAWQPNSLSVEVYLNGEYDGVYLLAEEIKISGDRVNVDDRNINEVDTGYLVELSNYASGEVIHAAGRSYMIHNDLSSDSSIMKQQREFIADYLDECYNALSGGTMEECAELIDLDSLVAIYLAEEIVKNLDSQWDSFYLHKDAGGKLVFGPIWDFDLSLGNANEGAEEYTDIFVGNGRGSGGSFGTWFAVALTQEWFRQMVADKWAEIYGSISLMPQFILDEGQLGFRSYERNFERWQIFGTVQNRETHYITRLKTYQEHYEYLAEWLTNRLEWLNGIFTDETFVTEGREIMMVQWMNQAGGNPWGNQGARYGNDATEELAEKYDNLEMYVKANTADGPDGYPGEGVRNLFDNDKNSKYCLEVSGEIEVTVDFKRAHPVKAYMFRTGNDTKDYSSRNPDSWAFYGRAGTSDEWTLIHEVTDGEENMGPTNQLWYGFETENTERYRYYKFVFREAGGTMQLSEIRFLGDE
jgi:hypothetical protein